jgi:sortase (surface protein transpeptidase)
MRVRIIIGRRVRRLALVTAATFAGLAAVTSLAPVGIAGATGSSPCGTSACAVSITAADTAPNAGTHGLRPAVRMAVPATVASAGPVVAAANESTCTTGLPGATMTIAIAAISYSCPVHAGGQAIMDAGAVAVITDAASGGLLAEHPGQAGTLWIAAHRSSHGGAFADVPALADGELVVVADGTATATYRIVGRVRVQVLADMVVDATGHATNAATLESIIRPDHGGGLAPRLLLQTCDGPTMRWMLYADLVTR